MGCDFKSPVGNNSLLLFIHSVKIPLEDFIQYVIQADEKHTLLSTTCMLCCKEQRLAKENYTNMCCVFH